jgi:hypothetical protein
VDSGAEMTELVEVSFGIPNNRRYRWNYDSIPKAEDTRPKGDSGVVLHNCKPGV